MGPTDRGDDVAAFALALTDPDGHWNFTAFKIEGMIARSTGNMDGLPGLDFDDVGLFRRGCWSFGRTRLRRNRAIECT